MTAYNEFLVISGHTSPGPGDDTMEMSGTQSSTLFYSENMYSDERYPLLMYTPTRNSTKKSSILYVDKAALHQMPGQQSQSGSR